MPNEMKVSDYEYLCKYYEHDGPKAIGYVLDRNEKYVIKTAGKLKKSGQFEFYKNLNLFW